MDGKTPFRWSVVSAVSLGAGEHLDVTFQMSDASSHLFYKAIELVDVEAHRLESYSSPYFAHNAATSRQLYHQIADLLGYVFQMRVEIVIRYFDILGLH